MPAVPIPFALTTHGIDTAIFHVADALQVPVLILALIALATVIYELGSFVIEAVGRRGRRFTDISSAVERARTALLAHDREGAVAAIQSVSRSAGMATTLTFIVDHVHAPSAEHQLNKALADFDLESQRRLGRTRTLVRVGPALGLMGTLIPLSPALTGLAHGNTTQLSDDLRIAFSITVVGLLIGAIAFAISLNRDRMYSQDLSDLQYVAAVLTDPRTSEVPA
jgi:biopolymer transport protein ExbB/TolQ